MYLEFFLQNSAHNADNLARPHLVHHLQRVPAAGAAAPGQSSIESEYFAQTNYDEELNGFFLSIRYGMIMWLQSVHPCLRLDICEARLCPDDEADPPSPDFFS